MTITQVTEEALLTVKEVAELLGASVGWVYRHANLGTIPSVRFGALLRFDPDAIRALKRGGTGRTPRGLRPVTPLRPPRGEHPEK